MPDLSSINGLSLTLPGSREPGVNSSDRLADIENDVSARPADRALTLATLRSNPFARGERRHNRYFSDIASDGPIVQGAHDHEPALRTTIAQPEKPVRQ